MLPDSALPFFSQSFERTPKHLYGVVNVKNILSAFIWWPHRMNQQFVCHIAGRVSNADIRRLGYRKTVRLVERHEPGRLEQEVQISELLRSHAGNTRCGACLLGALLNRPQEPG